MKPTLLGFGHPQTTKILGWLHDIHREPEDGFADDFVERLDQIHEQQKNNTESNAAESRKDLTM